MNYQEAPTIDIALNYLAVYYKDDPRLSLKEKGLIYTMLQHQDIRTNKDLKRYLSNSIEEIDELIVELEKKHYMVIMKAEGYADYFDDEEAVKYGLNGALLLTAIRKSIKLFEYLGEYYIRYDKDRTWVRISVAEFNEICPYLSDKQIRKALNKLLKKKVIIKEHVGPNPYDRTLWYSLNI
jgi:hypothetical protein